MNYPNRIEPVYFKGWLILSKQDLVWSFPLPKKLYEIDVCDVLQSVV
ncbi:hypothetical protein LT85_3579 [Collimonas arenae]|uniref:Uncharacterized protein n=1 Tax=Collimonas arenae TaxID=279058 RepID=A0A0A1FIS5_9BURK|nr:hypothetical protein LT85_3579 [Collimonas arenae]